MNCPVCQAANLPDELQKCPQCESDLEAFQLTRSIDKISHKRFLFAIISTVALVVVLLLWIFTGNSGPGPVDTVAVENLRQENSSLKSQLIQVRSDVERLQKENEELKQEAMAENELPAKIAVNQPEQQVREYIVQNGETLYGIARKIFGDGLRYAEIARDNNISDPGMIQTGQKLIIHHKR